MPKTLMKSKRLHAFTLIEVMAVLFVLMALTLLTVRVTGYVNRSSGVTRAKAEMAALASAIENYKLDNGVYPTSSVLRSCSLYGATGLSNQAVAAINSSMLLNQLTNPKVYLRLSRNQLATNSVVWGGVTNSYVTIVDPWKMPYNYICTRPPSALNGPIPRNSGGTLATTGQVNQAAYDLWSFGPDLANGTVDDITNWQR